MKLAVVLAAETFINDGTVSIDELEPIATALPPASAGFDKVRVQVPVAF